MVFIMQTFLFRFGFESPEQFHANNAHGWDDEDSQGVLISARTEDEALAWGRQIAEAFLQQLYQDKLISWLVRGYANWLEKPGEFWPGLQHVRVGDWPDYTVWLKPYRQDG